MKKLLIASIISSVLLTACDEKPSEKAVEKVAKVAKKAEVVKKTNVSPAEQAEGFFKASSQASNKYYQTILGSHPLIEKIAYEVISYEKGEDSATAVTKATINLTTEFAGKKLFDVTFNHDIKYDAATLASGLAAKVNSTVIKPEGLDADQEKFFGEFEKHFAYTTEISQDQTVNQDVVLKPFTFTAEDESVVAFKGINVNSKTTIKDLEGGFGQFVFDFKGMSVDEKFGIEPTSVKGEYKSNGDFIANSTAPLVITAEEGSISVENFTAKGNMKRNEKYDMLLGNGSYELKNVKVSGVDIPIPVSFKSALVNFDMNVSDKEIASQQFDIKLVPADGLIGTLSQGMVDASQIDIHYGLNNFPASILSEYKDMINTLSVDLKPESMGEKTKEMEAKFQTMFDSAKQQGAELDFNLGLTTTDGNVVIDSKTKIKSDSPITMAEIKDMKSPAVIFNLLDINANASVPAVLLEKTGMHMMAGPFLQKNGDVYESKVTTEGGKLLINGQPAPM